MKNERLLTLAILACALGSASGTLSAQEQITEVSRTPIASAAQLTFGYLCDDRFVIRNDDTKPVDLEYGLEKGTTHTKLTLSARESVELSSKSRNAIELWMDGKLIAKAKRENRSCKDVQGNGAVTVTPLEVASTQESRSRSAYDYGFGNPFYDPWNFGFYNSFGLRPYYSRFVSYPVVIVNRGGGRRGR
jgi:hypothetical protein